MKLARTVVLVCTIAVCGARGADSLRVWQDFLTLRTYFEGPPDTAPAFDAFAPGHSWYPYATRTGITQAAAPQTWRALHLENEYLACSILPDLGGRIYSCKDKLSGREMFYANPSVKKAAIGLRGAWVAMGVELNFPIGHSLVAVSPVDFGSAQTADRASVWVGATDRVTGMRWVVEFALRPGSAVLEQNVTVQNPTPVRRRYYWWSNAAVELQAGTRFVVPTRLVATHGTTNIDTWPVSASGVDKSVVANYRSGEGLFAHGCREPFLAIYHPGTRTATVHFADPAVVPGKKIWTWGTVEDQRIRGVLSDNSSAYAEIQAGLFENQETFEFLQPHEARRFSEYWIPARDLGGVARANLHAVVNLARRNSGRNAELLVEISANHTVPGAKIRVLDGSRVLLDQTADLTPRTAFSKVLNAPGARATLEVLDAAGGVLLRHTEGSYDAKAPGEVRPGPQPQRNLNDNSTEENLLYRAEYNERQEQFRFAEGDYELGLGSNPGRPRLLKGAGRLAAVMRRYDLAMRQLSAAAAASPGDAEVRYYLGVAKAASGDEAGAREEWRQAAGDAEFGPAALLETAASLARAGDHKAALDTLAEAFRRRRYMLAAGRMEIALLRRLGKVEAARLRLAYWRGLDPTDTILRFEQVQLGNPGDALWMHLAGDPERVLEIADAYIGIGLFEDAVAVLAREYPRVPTNQTEAGASQPQNHALVAYYRGYCRRLLGQNATQDFRAAASYPLAYVFPNRTSTVPVLRAALDANPKDAAAHMLLGLYYMNANMVDQAIGEWQTARGIQPNLAGLHAVLGQALLQLRKDPAGAVAVLREGLKLPAPDPQAARLLEIAMRELQPPLQAAHKQENPGNPQAPKPILRKELAAAALLRAAYGQLDEAHASFSAANFPEEKQDDEVREAYIEVELQRLRTAARRINREACENALDRLGGEDKSLPFTLYGFGAFMRAARFQYYLAATEAACGKEKDSRKRLARVAKTKDALPSPNYVFPLLAAARLDPSGARPKIEAALAEVNARLAGAKDDTRGLLLYSQGMLLRALGKEADAMAALQEGAKAPAEGMSQYLSALALRDGAGW